MKRFSWKSRLMIIAVVTVALAVGVLIPANAQGEPPQPVDPGQIPTLPAFLEMLAGPTGWVALGVLASMLLARWAWYNAQPSWVKRALPILAAIVLSIVARVLVTYVPSAIWEAIGPYWIIVAGAVMTWIGSQFWYHLAVRPMQVEAEEKRRRVLGG